MSAALFRLLLRQCDRHPVGSLSGADLARFPPTAVRVLLQQGILREQPAIRDAEDLVFQTVGNRMVAFFLDGGTVLDGVDPDLLSLFEIDRLGLCRRLRGAMSLEGAPAALLSSRLAYLGARGRGRRREAVYLARALRPDGTLDVGLAARGREEGGKVTILTPTERNLPGPVIRQLAAVDVRVLAVEPLLSSGDPPSIELPWPDSPHQTVAARLIIDDEGQTAILDGVELNLQRRVFAVLLLLAIEAAEQGGFVRREHLSTTLRQKTGNDDTNEEQVDSVISQLRRQLKPYAKSDDAAHPSLIETKKTVGYRLCLAPAQIEVT